MAKTERKVTIVGTPITVHLSEAEADVIQKALNAWIGPFGKVREEVDSGSHATHDSQKTLAEQIGDDLRNELSRRYELWRESDEGRKHNQELDRIGRRL